MDEIETREVSVQEGYALWAASYDQEKNGLIYVEEQHSDRLLSNLSFDRVLDVGTGTGRHALKLAQRGASVMAIDQSPEMLAVARQAAHQRGLDLDFQLVTLAEGLPFEVCQFDLLVCALMLSHVPNLAHAIQEFARVLRSGGHLLITDFHPAHKAYGWKTAFRREGVRYSLPTMEYSKEKYLETITNNHLTILEVLETPISEVPAGYLPEEMQRLYADKPLCLIILAQKENAEETV